MPELDEIQLKKNRHELRISLINGFFTIASSLLVAFVVSYYSQNSTLESVTRSTKSAEEIAARQLDQQIKQTEITNRNQIDAINLSAAKQLEQQIKQTEITNKNQIDAINLSAQKNLEALQENAKISRDLQNKIFSNEKELQLKKEIREQDNIATSSKTYLAADISIRISFLMDELTTLKKITDLLNSITLKDGKESFLAKTALIKGHMDGFGLSLIPVDDESIMKHLSSVKNQNIADTAIGFYRVMQVQYLLKERTSKFAKGFEGITTSTLRYFEPPENTQENEFKLFLEASKTTVETYRQFILRSILIGYAANIRICESSGNDCSMLKRESDELAKNAIINSEEIFMSYSKILNKYENISRKQDR